MSRKPTPVEGKGKAYRVGGSRPMTREFIQCDAKLNPKRSYIKRQRKDGSTYSVLIERGERCPEEAISSRRIEGKTAHRCAKHIGGY